MPGTALILAGGGSRGILQAGFIKAFIELGIKYDAVYAGSVGALNGILFLQDQYKDLEDLWLNVKNKDVYSPRILSIWKLITSDASIYDSKPLEKLIRKYINIEKLKSLSCPFIVNVTNLSTRQPECRDIRKLNLEEAVSWIKASASPPILFPSVTNTLLGELVDCGICNNYAISQAINDDYDTIICMTPTNAPPSKINNLLDIVEATISTASYGYLKREIGGVEKINQEIEECNSQNGKLKKIKLVVIRPPVSWNQGLINFNYKEDRKQLILYGYNLAKEILSKEFPVGGVTDESGPK